MTAIAARRRLAIFDIVFAPAFPKKRWIDPAKKNTTPAIKMFITIAAAVATSPYSLIRIIDVVSTAGPVINGTPKGTAPRLSGSTCR